MLASGLIIITKKLSQQFLTDKDLWILTRVKACRSLRSRFEIEGTYNRYYYQNIMFSWVNSNDMWCQNT